MVGPRPRRWHGKVMEGRDQVHFKAASPAVAGSLVDARLPRLLGSAKATKGVSGGPAAREMDTRQGHVEGLLKTSSGAFSEAR